MCREKILVWFSMLYLLLIFAFVHVLYLYIYIKYISFIRCCDSMLESYVRFLMFMTDVNFRAESHGCSFYGLMFTEPCVWRSHVYRWRQAVPAAAQRQESLWHMNPQRNPAGTRRCLCPLRPETTKHNKHSSTHKRPPALELLFTHSDYSGNKARDQPETAVEFWLKSV